MKLMWPMVFVLMGAVGSWLVLHRTSRLVKAWSPSLFKRRTAGPLSVLDSGAPAIETNRVVVLLHGLGATGDYFGDFYDGLCSRGRIVIVDLLGFGHSLDESRADYSVEAHVAALDQAFDALELDSSKITIAAHSMGTAVALTWANRHRGRVELVVLWGPPVYPSESDAREAGAEYGGMARLFLLDTAWAERLCRISCVNRKASGQMMALMAPRWPTRVSRNASQHTWEAYRQSLTALVLTFDWRTVFPARVPVMIFHGTQDPIGDHHHLASLVDATDLIEVPGGGHHIALTDPELLYRAHGGP